MFEVTGVKTLKKDRVSVNCLFLEVSHESVADIRGNHVCEKVGVEEYSLCQCDHNSKHDTGISLFEEEKEVHALIFSFLEQVVNPTMVTLQCAETS